MKLSGNELRPFVNAIPTPAWSSASDRCAYGGISLRVDATSYSRKTRQGKSASRPNPRCRAEVVLIPSARDTYFPWIR